MNVISSAKSDVGREREHNEDNFIRDPNLDLYVVCDGMGGHAAGEVASQLATETIAAVVNAARGVIDRAAAGTETNELESIMRGAVEQANAKVYELTRSKSKHAGAGTTCTALLVRSGTAVLAHVGDSRLYLCREGVVSQLSNDHTFVAEALKRGVLTPDEAANHRAGNVLTRAVGPQPRVHVDTLVFDLLPRDTLLLCSDGLHNYFQGTEELGDRLQADVETAATRLVDDANARGGEDNITVIVLRVDEPKTKAELSKTTNTHQNFDALRHITLLADLSLPEVMIVATAMTSETHPKDAVIVNEGDTSETMYVIVSGSLEVRRAGRPLAFLESGSHFGEMALLTNAPRSATVRTASPCRLLALHRSKLYDLAQKHPIIAMKFFWRLAQIQSFRLDDATVPVEAAGRTVRLERAPTPFDGSQR